MLYLKLLYVDDLEIRSELRKPQGKLFESFSQALTEAKNARMKGIPIISVGDRTTINFISNRFIPDLSVIDGMELRREAPNIKESFFTKVFEAENPRGTINTSISTIINLSLNSPPALIKIRGEEDLIALLICVTFQGNALLFYGQPRKGVVVITLNAKSRRKFKKLLDRIIELNRFEAKNLNFYY